MREIFRRTARTIADTAAEYSYAQRRLLQLRSAPDYYLSEPDAPPQDYTEFLFRTSGFLQHEPSARARARAHSRW
jgi:hypothetical protein